MEERILKSAEQLFYAYGIKSITMDDIASQLGISKKTIYQSFKDKKELVRILMRNLLDNQRSCFGELKLTANDAIDELLKVCGSLPEMFKEINPVFFYDLQKYHPDAWELYVQHKDEYVRVEVRKNLERGIAEGWYRKGLDVDILSKMRVMQIDSVFNPICYSPAEYNIFNLFAQITDHFLHGVCTLKGHQLINEYKQLHEA